jgi:hypothetical protein
MSWNYHTIYDQLPAEQLPQEWVWERLRNRRDQLLAQTDFRMIPDAPWDRAPWEAYRQALRDLPANTSDPREAVWPEPRTD